ncbi:AMP-binding protein [Corallococcus sp. 4LFB]|uniref:AMP-binding protein n=1 Tax=Corallococcus sp. 4LFB TaxID=3383249 RepID=UPI003976C32B
MALAFGDATLTYAQLDARANQLAHRLREWGVGPESRVGVCLERSLELVVSLLAVLKAGGAYVPFDPGYPAQRLTWMFQDARPTVLLAQEHLVPGLPPTGRAWCAWTRRRRRCRACPCMRPRASRCRTRSRTSSSRPAARAAPRAR